MYTKHDNVQLIVTSLEASSTTSSFIFLRLANTIFIAKNDFDLNIMQDNSEIWIYRENKPTIYNQWNILNLSYDLG